MRKRSMRFSKYLIYINFILIFSYSCAKNTLDQEPLTELEKEPIKNIAVLVESDNKFFVRVPKTPIFNIMGYSVTGIDLFFVIGSVAYVAPILAPIPLIAGLTKYGYEKSKEEPPKVYKIVRYQTRQYKKYVENYNPGEQLSQFIAENLGSSTDIFSNNKKSTVNLEQLRSKGYDNLLKLSIEQWGIYLCFESSDWQKYLESCDFENLQSLSETVKCSEPIPSNSIRAGVKISLELISLGRNKALYENEKLYLNPVCKNTENLTSIKEYLEEKLNETLNDIALNLVNQFLINN